MTVPLRSMWFVIAVALLGGLVGFGLSFLITGPAGAEHHCPAGSAPTSCRYPTDYTGWHIGWIVGGVIVVGFIGLLVREHVNDKAERALQYRPT